MKQDRTKAKRQRKYNASAKGIARQFRSNYGFSYEDSIFIARKCVHDLQRCEICGLPQWWNRAVLKVRGLFLRGDERVNRRLVPDHIIPGFDSRLENIRILCYACNDFRGAGILTDEEVLSKVRWWYRENFSLRDTWWLNNSPGKGGTLFRNLFMLKRAIRNLSPSGLSELKYLQIELGDSPDISLDSEPERKDDES